MLSKAYVAALGEESPADWFLGSACRTLCTLNGWTELHEPAAAAAAAPDAAPGPGPAAAAAGGGTDGRTGTSYDGCNIALMGLFNA